MVPESPFVAVVLTLNEIRNIDACLEGLSLVASKVLVIDSGSTDGTVERARALGATVVHHAFTTHAEQWTYGLGLVARGDWVIALDADQRVTPELAVDLLRIARTAGPEIEGIFVNRLHVFRGTPLRHGGLFPKWMLKVFRRGAGFTDPRELLDFRFYVKGATSKATGLLIEANQNEREISFWIEKHNRFSDKQAREEDSRSQESAWSVRPSLFGHPDQRILWLKDRWYRAPLYVRPFAYFLYRYLLRLGFLDGKQGFVFHVLQAFWYRLLVDIKLDELRSRSRSDLSDPA